MNSAASARACWLVRSDMLSKELSLKFIPKKVDMNAFCYCVT